VGTPSSEKAPSLVFTNARFYQPSSRDFRLYERRAAHATLLI
jgi:hypothetical protein